MQDDIHKRWGERMKVEYDICDNCGQQISNFRWHNSDMEFCCKKCQDEVEE